MILNGVGSKLQIDRTAIENYKLVKRSPVFSHDELVCKIATNYDNDVEIAEAIKKELALIIDYEKKHRINFKEEVTWFFE